MFKVHAIAFVLSATGLMALGSDRALASGGCACGTAVQGGNANAVAAAPTNGGRNYSYSPANGSSRAPRMMGQFPSWGGGVRSADAKARAY